MKDLYLLMLLSWLAPPTAAIDLPIAYVYDGDTIATTFRQLPPELQRVLVRINNIDTPELRGLCPEEIAKARKSKSAVVAAIGDAKFMTVTELKWDKYGGRVLGTVVVNNINIGNMLISKGLAREYHGEKKRGWCP